jgi:aryl carrier-like protein
VECALAAVWEHWGVRADLAIGHSMGEVSAATVSGALSVADAAAVMCRRSSLMRRAGGRGAMSVVQLTYDQATALVSRHRGRAVVAASNSATCTVLAGEASVLDGIERDLDGGGVFCRRVNAHVAAHGPAMDPLLGDLRGLLHGLEPRAGRFPLVSTVHCGRTLGEEFGAGYWLDNLRLRVRFGEAVAGVLAEGRPVLFVEMTPHPLLAHSVQECVDDAAAPAAVVSSLRRSEPGLSGLLGALAQAYGYGARVDWRAVAEPWGGRFAAPPPYPWQRRSYGVADAAPVVPASLVAGPRPSAVSGLRAVATSADEPVCDLAATRDWYPERLSGEVFAQRYGSAPVDGPQVLRAWRRPGEALALVDVPAGVDDALGPALWPVYRDLVRAAIPSTHALGVGPLELGGAESVRVLRAPQGPMWVAARLEYGGDGLRATLRGAGRDRLLVFEACDVALIEAARPRPAKALRRVRRPAAAAPQPAAVALSAADIHVGLLEQTARVLGLPPEQIDPDRPMIALGMDSLLAMELRRRLQRRLGVSIGPSAVLGGGTLRELARHAHAVGAGQA